MRRSSLDVSTTNGIWSALTSPSLGMLNCKTLKFKQHGFKCLVHLIQFIDQKHAAPVVLQRPQEWPCTKKVLTVQLSLGLLPVHRSGFRVQFHRKTLQGLIEFANGFLFVDTLETLQALYFGVGCFRHCIRKFRLAASWRSFEQQGLV